MTLSTVNLTCWLLYLYLISYCWYTCQGNILLNTLLYLNRRFCLLLLHNYHDYSTSFASILKPTFFHIPYTIYNYNWNDYKPVTLFNGFICDCNEGNLNLSQNSNCLHNVTDDFNGVSIWKKLIWSNFWSIKFYFW